MTFKTCGLPLLFVAIASVGCSADGPSNVVDPTGPAVRLVHVCYNHDRECFISGTLPAGGGLLLEANATSETGAITSDCKFAWKGNSSGILILVNGNTQSAVITRDQFHIGGAVAITATCNGISGVFTLE